MVLEQTRPPFDTSHVLAINLPVMNYGRTPEQVRDFYRDVKQRVAAIPGVEHVSTGFSVPWRDSQGLDISLAFAMDGAARQNAKDDLRGKFRAISPGFFSTLGVPLLEGRDFRDTDKDGSERVVIISQSVAKKLFPGQDPLNREMRWTDPVIKFIGISDEPRRVVGVVPDIDDENIIPEPGITIYQPTDQEGWESRLFVRTKGDPYTLVPIDHPHHPRHVGRAARRARQHPRRHSRRGPHPRPPQRHRLRRIRRRRALHLRRRRRRRSRLLRQRAHPRIRHPHGPRRAAPQHPHRRPLRGPRHRQHRSRRRHVSRPRLRPRPQQIRRRSAAARTYSSLSSPPS